MKKIGFVLLMSVLFLGSKAQIIFETQQQVDSFVVVMDTSINYHYHFYYDDQLPENERITDLSGFDEDGWMYIRLFYFEIEDMPWFKSFHQGQLYFINMPNLKTFSGLKNIDHSVIVINNCPSLNSFPPQGLLKYNGELWVTNQTLEQFEIDLSGALYKEDGPFNKVYLYNNNIKRLVINDPNGAAESFEIVNDSALRYLEFNSASFQSIDLFDNPLLDSIRGFKKAETIVASVKRNPNLKDLCAMRYGWDNHYQSLPQRDKDNFNTGRIVNNGVGASTYEEMMATDCSWLADTFTTVAVHNGFSQSNVSMFPNPVSRVSGSVSIAISPEKFISNIQITNLQGKQVYSNEHIAGHSTTVDIGEFAAGFYTVLIIDNTGFLSKRKLVVVE